MASADALREADGIIEALQKQGLDYTAGREEIARVVDEDIWGGNYDSTTDFDPALGLRDLRIIEENEYDQSMDEDERPSWDSMITSYGNYIFYA